MSPTGTTKGHIHMVNVVRKPVDTDAQGNPIPIRNDDADANHGISNNSS